MDETTKPAESAEKQVILDTEILENGDLYDEDTGEYLATLEIAMDSQGVGKISDGSIPASLSIFFNGYWYIYKIDSRYKHVPSPKADEL